MTDDLQQAYEAGAQDGRMGAKTSDINAVELQKRLNYSDEAVICYLNGVGDGDLKCAGA